VHLLWQLVHLDYGADAGVLLSSVISTHLCTSTAQPHTHLFTQVSQYQKGKTNLDSAEAREGKWQWHQLGHICKSAPRSRQITTPAPHYSSFLQAGCPSCHPTNSVKAVKALLN